MGVLGPTPFYLALASGILPEFAEAGPKQNPNSNQQQPRGKRHGGASAEGPPPQVSENLILNAEELRGRRAGQRGAVADSRKNLIGKGRELLSDPTGELLTQTLSSEPLNCRRLPAKWFFP